VCVCVCVCVREIIHSSPACVREIFKVTHVNQAICHITINHANI
jgi:hypothetical protein